MPEDLSISSDGGDRFRSFEPDSNTDQNVNSGDRPSTPNVSNVSNDDKPDIKDDPPKDTFERDDSNGDRQDQLRSLGSDPSSMLKAPQADETRTNARNNGSAQKSDADQKQVDERRVQANLSEGRRQSTNPSDSKSFTDSDNFKRLDEDVRARAQQQYDKQTDKRLKDNLAELARSPTFGAMGKADQSKLLDRLSESGDKGDQFRDRYRAQLADKDYRSSSTQARADRMSALLRDGRDALSGPAQEAVDNLRKSKGFDQMARDEQDRMLKYVGGDNKQIAPGARDALSSMMKSQGFRDGTPKQQADWMQSFLKDQPGATRSRPGPDPKAGTAERSGPNAVDGFPFRSGSADANRFDLKYGGQTITAYAPKNPDPSKGSFHSIDQVETALSRLPQNLREQVRQVHLEPGPNPGDKAIDEIYKSKLSPSPGDPAEAKSFDEWANRYRYQRDGAPTSFRSYMTAAQDGVVNIYPTSRPAAQREMDGALVHETGHILSQKTWGPNDTGPSWAPVWRDAIRNDGFVPSAYAQKGKAREDFSDTLKLYQAVKGTSEESEVRGLMPARFRIIDAMLRSR